MMISPATSTDWDDTGDTPANSYTVLLYTQVCKPVEKRKVCTYIPVYVSENAEQSETPYVALTIPGLHTMSPLLFLMRE